MIRLPIQHFLDGIAAFGSGDLAVRLPMGRVQELNILSARFNDMACQISALMDEVYEKQQLLYESELCLLQSQMDPHFIFNVLQLVSWKATELHSEEINQLISALAELIRSGIALRGHEKIPLREELHYVTGYLDLQCMRYKDRLAFQIDVENEQLEQYLVPKLLIQPLVENSIIHGFEPKCGTCTVCIEIWEKMDSLFCCMLDNGVGFCTDQKLSSCRPPAHNHIALENIQRRMKLLYGQSCGFKISSSSGQGTEVLIQIPIEEGEDG